MIVKPGKFAPNFFSIHGKVISSRGIQSLEIDDRKSSRSIDTTRNTFLAKPREADRLFMNLTTLC